METREVLEFGRITSANDWVLYGGILAMLLTFAWIVYRKDTFDRGWFLRLFLVSLRWSVYGLLFWVFLDHRTRLETEQVRDSRVLVVADTSRSMTTEDAGATDSGKQPSRQARLVEALAKTNFLDELRQKHVVEVLRFGRELQDVATLDKRRPAPEAQVNKAAIEEQPVDWKVKLPPDEDQTRLGDVLIDLLKRKANPSVSGIVLLTDGRSNAGGSVETGLRLAKAAKLPVYAIGMGSDRPPINLRLAGIQVPSRAFRGDEFKVTGFVQGAGMENRTVSIELLLKARDVAGEPAVLERRDVKLSADGTPVPVEFTYKPKELGHWQVSLRAPIDAREIRTDDNQAAARFEVVDRKTKVLLFAGGPTREYQFVRSLLFRDKSIELVVLLQTARDKISQDASTVLGLFPDNRDDLFSYDCIIAIDPDWAAVEPKSRDLLAEWVSSQAGGLIAIAGPIHTPRLARDEALEKIQELYPVVLREVFSSEIESAISQEAWPLVFSSDGESTDFLRLDDDPAVSKLRWKDFAGFFSCFPVANVKPGASVLANFSDPRAQKSGLAPPVFALQYYGAGRVLYIGSGEVWRLRRVGENYFDRFWVRTIRQLSQGRLLRGASRGTLLLERERYPLGDVVPIRAHLLNEEYKPSTAPSVSISVVDPAGKTGELVLKPQLGKKGQFIAQLPALLAGHYRLQLIVPGSGEPVERDLEIEVPRLEFDDPRLDRATLTRLATETGGQFLRIEDLGKIPPLLEDKTEKDRITGPPKPLWDKAWVMIAVSVLLSIEWLTRKLSTLA